MRFARDTEIRKFVLLLGIWLLAAASFAQEPAKVVYTHRGTFDRGLARIGGECWCSYDLARKWGWSIIPVGNEIDIQAEGRRIRLTPVLNGQEKGIPLVAATEQLGGVTEWLPGNKLQMLGVVRDVEVLPSGIKIGATLGVKPKTFKLDGPDRLVIDLEGAELPKEASFGLPQNVRVGIVDEGVTRIVVESPKVRSMPLPTLRQGRKVDVSLPGFNLIVAKNPDGTPIASAPTPSDMVPRDPGAPVIGQAEVVRESEKETVLRFPYTGTVSGYPSASYLGPELVSITLPTMSPPTDPTRSVSSDAVKSVDYSPAMGGSLTINVSLNRPMIFALSINGQEVVLRLVKPNVRGGGLSGKVVVVDPGHGGKDSGATWDPSGTMEKNLTLAIGRKIAKELTEAGASVIMTRDDDRFIPLDERPAVANRSNADVFVSVHINSNSVDNSASGIYSFYHLKDPTCILLAECIQSQMDQTGLPLKGIRSDTIRFKSGFAVLRGSQMPAVLLELGFINHKTDRSKITTSEFQVEAAKAVVRGLKVFFGNGQSNR